MNKHTVYEDPTLLVEWFERPPLPLPADDIDPGGDDSEQIYVRGLGKGFAKKGTDHESQVTHGHGDHWS